MTITRSFWNFDDLLTVRIIPVLFKLAVVFNLIAGILSGIIAGIGFYQMDIYPDEDYRILLGILVGLFFFAIVSFIFTIVVRLSFEIIIVVFKIWENTKPENINATKAK